jgi:RNA polymerase sigma-70 factor (ECF subfamily)
MTTAPSFASVGAADAARPSFERIFRDEVRFVGRTLRYLGVPASSVEDACQEVFLVVHRRLADFDGASLRGWVRQICVHVARNQRRTQRRRPEDAVAETPEIPHAADQHLGAERSEARMRLLRALDALGEDQRAVFVLYEIEQMTMQECAETLGIPVQTGYSRLHAARACVRRQLEGDAQ